MSLQIQWASGPRFRHGWTKIQLQLSYEPRLTASFLPLLRNFSHLRISYLRAHQSRLGQICRQFTGHTRCRFLFNSHGLCKKGAFEKEIIMKSLLLFTALLSLAILSNSSAPPAASAAAVKEKAVAKFDGNVTLMDIRLKGEYLFVHDDAAMMRGEACTFVYKGVGEKPENLIIYFHCTPRIRAIAQRFIVRTLEVAPGQFELREYQFAGSPEGHLVPVSSHAEHVTLATPN